jgi:hypothetical protein
MPVRPDPRRWRKRTRELLELFVVPFAATLLPWPWILRLTWRLSRWRGWHHVEVALATANAQRYGVAPDPAAFARRLRWRLLIDSVDGFLVPMRGRRYLDRWVRADGDPLPSAGPVMFVGTHHGCGFWFLPYLREHGLPLNIIAPRLGPLLVNASLQENLYGHMRHRMIAKAAGRPLVYRGNAAEGIRQLLAAGEVGFGLADIPTQRPDAVEVCLAGHATRLAQNLFELAAQHAAPVYLFSSDTDLASGMRHIHLRRMPADSSPEQQVREFAQLLDASIRRDPSGWRFWSIADAFFAPPPSTAVDREGELPAATPSPAMDPGG